MTDADLTEILHRDLLSGERLLWSGRPDPARMRKVFAIWGFAIPWTAFALFWEAASLLPWSASSRTPDAIAFGFGLVFPLFGIPFIVIGAGMMAAPFVILRTARQTIFGLTDRRLLKLTAGRRRESKSLMLDQMGAISVQADADGFGTLCIETGSHVDSDGDRRPLHFEVTAVPQVARLEALLLQNRAS